MGQEAANAGMIELQRQFEQAQQRLASQESASSTRAVVERSEALEEELQLKDKQLQEACAAGSNSALQAQLASVTRERNEAQWRVQELLVEGQTLTTQHQELKVQLATMKTEYESRLRVAAMELESCQK